MQDTVETRNVETKTKVFVSYSRKDMAFADKLEAALKARGFEVLIDRQEIYAFEDWWKRIEALIGGADTVVFALSPDSVQSPVALKEVTHAAALNKRFAPIVCREVEERAVPETLRRLNFIFFDDPDCFDESADKLADALETDINWIRQHTEYGQAERRWSSVGRPNGLLLQTPTLDLAEYWLASRPRNAPEPTEEIRSYVIASRKQALASKRLWRVVLASMFMLLAGIIVGLVGWINQSYVADQWRWWTVTRPYATAQIWPYVLSAASEQALKAGDGFRECAPRQQDQDYCPDMVLVRAGAFMMGSPQIAPQHNVTIAAPFAVSNTEITFDEWETCVTYGDCRPDGVTRNGWEGGQRPVISVTWNNAQQYVSWLSKMTGKRYRLLSEAEYEYAARGGTQTTYPWGDDIGKNNANCDGCGSEWSNKQTAPVRSFAPNQFGLYDMVGNVWEWTQDCRHDTYAGAPEDGLPWVVDGNCYARVLRGGSWNDPPERLQSAWRGTDTLDSRNDNAGFRVARALMVR